MAVIADIILLAIFALTVWTGYKRGILKTGIRLILFVGAILLSKVLATALTPALSEALPLPGIGTKLASYLNINFAEGGTNLGEVLTGWGIPKAAAENIEQYFDRTAQTTGESISRQLTPALDKLLTEAIVFVFLLILLLITAALLTALLDRAIELPVIGSVDRACGLAVGAVTGFFLIAIIAFAATWLFPLLDASLDLELTDIFVKKSFLIRMFNSINPFNGLLG